MKFLKQKYKNRFMKESGIRPTTKTEPEDVFVIGYPRSGHTWMQQILADLVYGVDPLLAPIGLITDVVVDIHEKKFYKRYRERCLFKAHNPPEEKFRRVIYLIRDGRDVLVSYWHFRQATGLGNVKADENFLASQKESSWIEHVQAWLDNPYDADICYLKYEDLKNETEEQIGRVADFLEIERSPEHVRRVAEHCQAERLRAAGRSKIELRKGKVGSYRDELPKEELVEFEKSAGPLLKKLGYMD